VFAAGLLGLGQAAAQQASTVATPWTFRVAPYLWAPSVDAELRYGLAQRPGDARRADISIDAGDLLGALNFGVMVAAEARRDRFSMSTDLIYLDLSEEKGVGRAADYAELLGVPLAAGATVDARTELQAALWGLAAGYTLAQGGWGQVDGTAGFRLLNVEARSDVRLDAFVAGPGPGLGAAASRRLKDSATLFDGVVGVRGEFALGSGFSLPYAFDIGGGSANLTWQAMGGVAYQWGRTNITLGYRALHYEQGGDRLLRDLTLAGPFLAASFRF
jgi:hypothetical protein